MKSEPRSSVAYPGHYFEKTHMNIRPACRTAMGIALLLTACAPAFPQVAPASTTPGVAPQKNAFAKPGGQELLLPPRIGHVPAGNDFNKADSEFCFQRSKATEHFVLFWAKEYGADPLTNSVAKRRFNVDEVLKEADRFYRYYVDTLKWVDRNTSFATQYKFLFFVVGGTNGTAFGGSTDNKIGTFWTPATRINHGPYGVVAHELGHSFQALDRADGAASFSGPSIGEMTSQFMLWQVYPEWQTFENYHLNDFMKATHLAFLHRDNQYHTCYPLEYWSCKQGVDFIGKMWREVQRGEDPVMTYKRLTKINQQQFNDEMFDACRRFVTWDLPRIDKVAARYADQHSTSLNRSVDNWYRIAADKCPQNYGYNAIKLKVPAAHAKVTLAFKGLAGAQGFSQTQLDKAGWRYGFLAHKDDGSRVYSQMCSKANGSAEFSVPANTKFLWLVVMGAPTEHWIRPAAPRGRAAATAPTNTSEQWPYTFHLTGTSPVDSIVH